VKKIIMFPNLQYRRALLRDGSLYLTVLLSFHPETSDEKLLVPEPERRNFLFRQGTQGFARRRTTCTPHKKNRRLTAPGRKSTLSGRELLNELDYILRKKMISFLAIIII
jgi:hypothetical protein